MKPVTISIRNLTGLWEKSIGLIGKETIEPVFFRTRWGIHTFGMKVPIDVVILDDNNRVVKLTRAAPPNKIFLWNPRYQNVLELPEGEIKKRKIAIGSTVILKINNASNG